MAEWKLFDGDPPGYTSPGFFRDHPWVPPAWQAGHAERTVMAADVIRKAVAEHGPGTLSDLGCGDGSLLDTIRDLPVRAWGYDAGTANVAAAAARGLDVRQADILASEPGLDYGELVTCCEVLEHLASPQSFLAALPGTLLVLTSPSAESAHWHYEHHAWAWDTTGYAALVTGAGWRVTVHDECDGGMNYHGGETRPQRFQAVLAVRA